MLNKVIMQGRPAQETDVQYSQGKEGKEPTAFARTSLAVQRRGKNNGADFIPCVAFGRNAEILSGCSKTTPKTKIDVCGRMQSGSYTNKEGKKVYTLELVIEEIYFCESKKNGEHNANAGEDAGDGFVMPDNIDEEIPFN